MPYKMIQVGTGGFGAHWCRRVLPAGVADGLVEVVAAADINPDALAHARRHLGLPADRCYTDVRKAFEENPADFCAVVVPPGAHEQVVDEALAHGLDVLCEKPIADTLPAACRIAAKVAAAGRKMGVTMSHRFRADITTLRRHVHSGEFGPLDYLVCRFTCNCRAFGSWGRLRHEMPDALMIEGSVHHLDLLADIAARPCETIYAHTWTPPWGQFAGDAQGLVLMRMADGARAVYEGAKCNATGLNCWGNEYIRAECEGTTLILDRRRITRLDHRPEAGWAAPDAGRLVPLDDRPKWEHDWLLEKFCRWLDGGEPMETNVADNLQSVAMIFAAIRSSRTGRPVNVQQLLHDAAAEAVAS
jgi:predicted dehydrogenase